jgi:DNA-binding beta-propeller fold protein YncE
VVVRNNMEYPCSLLTSLSLAALILIISTITGVLNLQTATARYVFENMWGTEGSGDGQFKFPRDVVRDSSRNVFVSDNGNHRIQKFHIANPCPTGTTQVATNICFVTKWGTEGSGDGQFLWPGGMAIDSSGNLYVADSLNDRIQKFSNSGNFITSWGMLGSGDGQFSWPADVAVGPDGSVFVTDMDNYRIQKFSSTGTFIRSWGSEGSGEGQFDHPRGVAVAPDGSVFVADTYNNRIQKFSNTGTFIRSWNPTTPDPLGNPPYDIAVDSAGDVYVSVAFSNKIEKYSNTGTFITAWGKPGTGEGELYRPYGLYVATPGFALSQQYVYVTEWWNNRTQVFTWKPDVPRGATSLNNSISNVTNPDLHPGATSLNNSISNVTNPDLHPGATSLNNSISNVTNPNFDLLPRT